MIDWSAVRYFTAAEFQCRCGCDANLIQPGLVYKLDDLRHAYGKSLTVTSGYRCPEHNARVSSTGATGPHTTGLAVDLGVSGRDAVAVLKHAFMLDFLGFGVNQKGGGRFIHLDIIPDSHGHKRPAIWSY